MKTVNMASRERRTVHAANVRAIAKAQLLIDQLEEQNRNLVRAEIAERYGVAIGCDVMHGGRRYQVTRISDHTMPEQQGSRRPWLHGRLYKADGKLGVRATPLFNRWELVR